jgi:hypothetical protein
MIAKLPGSCYLARTSVPAAVPHPLSTVSIPIFKHKIFPCPSPVMRSYLAIVARPELPCLFPPPLASSSPLVNCAHSFPFLFIRSNLAGVHGQNFTPPLYFRTLRVRSYQQFTLFIILPPRFFGCSFYSEATWQVLHGQNFNAPPRAIFLASCKVCPPRTRPSPQDCIHRTVDRKLALTLSLIYGEQKFLNEYFPQGPTCSRGPAELSQPKRCRAARTHVDAQHLHTPVPHCQYLHPTRSTHRGSHFSTLVFPR